MAKPLQILTMGLARASCLEAVDLVVPATAQNIVDGIGNHRNENQDRRREPGQRYLLLIDHPSMVRRGTCAALSRASAWPHLRDRKHLIANALEAGVERRAENLLPNGATRCRTAMKGRWIGEFQHDGGHRLEGRQRPPLGWPSSQIG